MEVESLAGGDGGLAAGEWSTEATQCQRGEEQGRRRGLRCRGLVGCQVIGVRGGVKRAAHGQLAGRRAPGTRVLLAQPFTSASRSCRLHQDAHCAGGARGHGMGGCGKNQRALYPTPRRACCTPGTRDSPSVQSCLLGPGVWPGDR